MKRTLLFLWSALLVTAAGSGFGSRPEIFLIGAGKCGTTSLYQLLIENKEICSKSELKEPHFFDKDDIFARGKDWYFEKLSVDKCQPFERVVDGSPRYIRTDEAPQRLAASFTSEQLRKKRFILILREPVAREFSWYEHKLRVCTKQIHWAKRVKSADLCGANEPHLTPHFCEAVGCSMLTTEERRSNDPSQYLFTFKRYYNKERVEMDDGKYFHHIKNWLKYIDRSQLFIVSFQTLIVNTTDVMDRLQRFLGLSTTWGINVTLPHTNSAQVKAVLDCRTHDLLQKQFLRLNDGLYDLINSPDKPAEQPHFPEFEDTRRKCED